ncbi:MAG: fatty acid desaturase [Planctomycetota bacterium]|jgi:omega-6 fatty acid desaturase (delta-12 desaturase)|nr:fatty acid desaturase [Planctomycetota bacterium]
MSAPLPELRTGPALIKATAPYTEESPWLSWGLTLSSALILTAAWAALVWASLSQALNAWALSAAGLLVGLLLVRMFVIYHDYAHGAILRKSRIARALMGAFGVFVLAPPSIWRSSHDYHHKNNSKLRAAHIGSFPVMTVERWAQTSRSDRLKYRFLRHPLTIALAYPIGFFFGMCLGPFLRNPRRHWDGAAAVLLHVGLAALCWFAGGWELWLYVHVLPHVVACAVGGYLFYAQHNFPEVEYFDAEGWTYHAAALDSSSYMKMGPVMNWFTANIGYHHIHHLNARIPFYRLPQVMAEIPELQRPRTTSLNPFAVWRCLRLDLWDPRSKRMVRFSG